MTEAITGSVTFPFPRANSVEPPGIYTQLREEAPVYQVHLWNGQRAWLLTRFEDFKTVTTDGRFSGDFSREDFPSVTEARQAIDRRERSFVGMDNPRHDHFRRMLTQEFSVARMSALKPAIQTIVKSILDEMERHGPPMDLVAALSNRLPALVMCEMFGTPYEDHEVIMRCAAGRHGLRQSVEEATNSSEELADYCARMIADKEREPGADFVSRVIASHVAPGALSREDFCEMLAMLLRAGHDTTANMISLGTLLLLQQPEELAALQAEPGLIPGAVEEMLRYLSPVQFAPRRVALEDVAIGGAVIRKGDGVFPLNPAANRDGAMFDDPDSFDVRRKVTRHAAFGYGIHVCLGQVLARFELQIVFASLIQRFPKLALGIPPEQVRFKTDMQIFGAYALPVSW